MCLNKVTLSHKFKAGKEEARVFKIVIFAVYICLLVFFYYYFVIYHSDGVVFIHKFIYFRCINVYYRIFFVFSSVFLRGFSQLRISSFFSLVSLLLWSSVLDFFISLHYLIIFYLTVCDFSINFCVSVMLS